MGSKKRATERWLFISIWVTMFVVLASCSPTVDPSNNPGRGFVGPCPAGQRKVCVGQCAAVSNRDGASCDLDPCVPGSRPAYVCGPNLRCEPCPLSGDRVCQPGEGVCRAITPPPEQGPVSPVCDPHTPLGSINNPCLQTPGQFCRSVTCGPLGVRNAPGLCSLLLAEGQEDCDADFANVLNPPATGFTACSPCGPGLACMRRPDGASTPRGRGTVCLRRCDAVVNAPSTVVNAACQPPVSDGVLGRGTYDYRCELHSRNPSNLGSPGTNVVAVCVRATPHSATCGTLPSYESRPTTDTIQSLQDWCPGFPRLPSGRCPMLRPGTQEQQFVVSNRQYTALEPAGSPAQPENLNPCVLGCDSCQPNTHLRGATNDHSNSYACCRQQGQGCDQDSDCCQQGTMPARCVPYNPPGATQPSGSIQRVCRRGCDPAIETSTDPNAPRCPGNTACTPMAGRRLTANPWPQPAPGTVAGSIPSTGTPPSPVCMPCGQEGERCCEGLGRATCGVAAGPNLIANGQGSVVLPNLVCAAGVCRDRRQTDAVSDPPGAPSMPPGQRCGDLGQACCPEATGNGLAFQSLPGGPTRIPQGSRCRAGGICGANNTCVRCGVQPGDPCCDLDLSNVANVAVTARIGTPPSVTVGAPRTPLQTLAGTAVPDDFVPGLFASNVCGEQRRQVDLTEELICPPAAPNALTPRRCGPLGLACVQSAGNPTDARHNAATDGPGVCVACGLNGQPCCDGQYCQRATDSLLSNRAQCGSNNLCNGCGGCGQPTCTGCMVRPCDAPWVAFQGQCVPPRGMDTQDGLCP